mmetsp:Transcript_81778/g.265008  ORF Transcript_81778/g.265008 Transcript_81778/m.265008 type:complete len:282 (+) Transcript_81778:55-900(+)
MTLQLQSPHTWLGASPERARGALVAEGTRNRLSELADRFSGFERQVEADTRARKLTEEASIEVVRESLARLEHAVEAEVQARTAGQSSLQAAFEARLSVAQGRLEALFLEQFDHVHSLVDALGERMGLVERDFLQSRERYVEEMAERSAALERELTELRRALEEELAERQEREAAVLTRLSGAEARAAERLGHGRRLCEQRHVQLARDAEESARARQEAHGALQRRAAAELEEARRSLAAASRARERADDDIATALNHYTRGLQDAVCGLSQGALQAATAL